MNDEITLEDTRKFLVSQLITSIRNHQILRSHGSLSPWDVQKLEEMKKHLANLEQSYLINNGHPLVEYETVTRTVKLGEMVFDHQEYQVPKDELAKLQKKGEQ